MCGARLKIDDAFGLALWYKHHGGEVSEIVETPTGHTWANDIGRYFSPYAKWSQTEKCAIAHLNGAVLDIGCGAGRHSLFAQEKGHEVTAIDSSFLATEVARLRGVQKTICLPIDELAHLDDGQYDTVLLLGHNLGLLGGRKRAKRLLKALHEKTSPTSIIIGESTDPKDVDKELLQHTRGRLPGQIRLRVRCRNVATNWMDYCYYAPCEIEEILRGTGWVVRKYLNERRSYVVIIGKE